MNHFELKCTAFMAAVKALPHKTHDCFFSLAGKKVHLKVVGDELFPMIEAAFSHLSIPVRVPSAVDLKIRLWDVMETGIDCPAAPPDDPYSLNGHIGKSDDGIIVSHYRPQIYCTMDRSKKSIVGACKGARHMSLFDRGKPLHALIGVWLTDIGTPFLHGGVVASQGRGILLGGGGGSGKSTTALACLEAGWDYLGDDAIAVEQIDKNRFAAHSIYASTTLAPDHMRNFSGLSSYAVPGTSPGEDKDLVILSELYPGQLKPSARIEALVIPTVGDKSIPRIYPQRGIEALLSLAPSSVLYLPNAGESYLNLLSNVTQSVPCYRLELGADIARIPACMSGILSQVVIP